MPGFLLKIVDHIGKLFEKVSFGKKKKVTLNKYKAKEDESGQDNAEENKKSKVVKDEKKEEEEKLFKKAIFSLRIIAFLVLFLAMLISFIVIWVDIAG